MDGRHKRDNRLGLWHIYMSFFRVNGRRPIALQSIEIEGESEAVFSILNQDILNGEGECEIGSEWRQRLTRNSYAASLGNKCTQLSEITSPQTQLGSGRRLRLRLRRRRRRGLVKSSERATATADAMR